MGGRKKHPLIDTSKIKDTHRTKRKEVSLYN